MTRDGSPTVCPLENASLSHTRKAVKPYQRYLSRVKNEMTKSKQRQTAEAAVAALNNMDVAAYISLRSPDCIREIVPKSLKISQADNDTYERHLNRLHPIFRNFELTVNDVVEDRDARKICMWLSARADTVVGEYVNEYVWTMTFDESGEKIVHMREFVDAIVQREFWPKLREAMKNHTA